MSIIKLEWVSLVQPAVRCHVEWLHGIKRFPTHNESMLATVRACRYLFLLACWGPTRSEWRQIGKTNRSKHGEYRILNRISCQCKYKRWGSRLMISMTSKVTNEWTESSHCTNRILCSDGPAVSLRSCTTLHWIPLSNGPTPALTFILFFIFTLYHAPTMLLYTFFFWIRLDFLPAYLVVALWVSK